MAAPPSTSTSIPRRRADAESSSDVVVYCGANARNPCFFTVDDDATDPARQSTGIWTSGRAREHALARPVSGQPVYASTSESWAAGQPVLPVTVTRR
ncbi:hypothetical protein GCM10017776_10390 [Streptomyces griseoluteus]|nr:hypothetical protein GCM10017776_10390 [Streptomyces griseoluteus]